MKRNKTDMRHVNTKTGKVTRVTECDGKYYIGDTNIRAEGNMTHYNGVKHINYGKNRFRPIINDEWSDYAKTSDDL